MNVLVRIKKSSFVQQWYFGNRASRPYITIENIEDEDEIKYVIRAYINRNRRILQQYNIRTHTKPIPGEFEYVPITRLGFGKAVYLGYIT